MPPFDRHDKIFTIWETLKPGQILRIINDHDPKPLHYQLTTLLLIAHGFDLAHGMDQQKAAVLSGHWPLMRYKMLLHRNPVVVKRLLEGAQKDVLRRWQLCELSAAMPVKYISQEEE